MKICATLDCRVKDIMEAIDMDGNQLGRVMQEQSRFMDR